MSCPLVHYRISFIKVVYLFIIELALYKSYLLTHCSVSSTSIDYLYTIELYYVGVVCLFMLA